MAKESVSMEMTRIAREYIAQGHRVYTLSVGDTHFSLPGTVQVKLNNALKSGHTHYLDSMGLNDLRSLIAEHEFKGAYTAKEILIVPGVKQGLYYFLSAFGGRKIAILEPAWLGYHSICEMNGKEIIRINTKRKNWLRQLAEADFDCLLLCTPNNPDGRIYSETEIAEIRQLALTKNAVLAVDEIYALYSFDSTIKKELQPLYKEHNVITFSGFSKGYAATGLRLGYVATHDTELLKSMNIINQNTATCANSLAQYAFLKYNEALPEVEKYISYYKENRDIVCKLFPEISTFKPDGGFYYFIDLAPFGVKNGEVFCKDLLEQKKVALVPGSAYGNGFDSWIRLSYSIDRQELTDGINILKEYVKNI